MRERRLSALKPAEHDGVDGADACDREHRDDRLGDHGQVDRDAVALADAQSLEHVGDALDLVGELGVGDAAGVTRFALPVQGGRGRRCPPRRDGRGSCRRRFSSPSSNHFANGGLLQSSTWVKGLCQCTSSRDCSPQKASRSAAARSYSSGDVMDWETNSSDRRGTSGSRREDVVDLAAHRQALLCGIRVLRAWSWGSATRSRRIYPCDHPSHTAESR